MKLSTKQIRVFQKEILDWYSKNKRDLPWRANRDPYSILISEVMLQQTQVSRVIPKFNDWMKEFPTIQSLAKSPMRDVLSLWSGLGYNRRALYLQRLAKEVVKNNNSMFSQNEHELKKLPGIGEYTARALLCFAFDRQMAVVDTNIRKVILTKFQIPDRTLQMSKREIQDIADMLLPKGKAYIWNQALMDYAANVLKKQKIPIPKQKPFKNSDRYYRGEVLRVLLRQGNSSLQDLMVHFSHIKKSIHKERLEKILGSLEKDNFIERNSQEILIKQHDDDLQQTL